jgi:hypothetical protein
MKNRAILSRIGAKSPAKKERKARKVDVQAINMVDPESGEILATFVSLDEAVEKEELNRPNLIGAVKNGNKYKGMLWKKA